jgi:ferric-dicitrate binding protein FerR (iron transport regulator)
MKLIILLTLIFSIIGSKSFAFEGRVVFIKGEAFVNKLKVKSKSEFKYGDTFSTGKDSMAIIKINPGLQIKLKPNSILEIQKPKKNKKGKTYSYALETGEIFIQAEKSKKNKHNFTARDSVMGIRGTQFFISNRDKGKKNIWMCVNEGAVEVSVAKNEKTVLVKAGEGIQIDSDKLPKVKQYTWTNDLNWLMEGTFDEVNDLTDIQNINYDLESMNYD